MGQPGAAEAPADAPPLPDELPPLPPDEPCAPAASAQGGSADWVPPAPPLPWPSMPSLPAEPDRGQKGHEIAFGAASEAFGTLSGVQAVPEVDGEGVKEGSNGMLAARDWSAGPQAAPLQFNVGGGAPGRGALGFAEGGPKRPGPLARGGRVRLKPAAAAFQVDSDDEP